MDGGPMLYIIIILIGLLFVREVMVKWFKQFFNISQDENGNEKPPQWAQDLKEHYNDETTQYLQKVHENQQTLLQISRDSQRDHKDMKERTKKTNRCLERIERDGVKIKKNGNA